MPPRLMTATSVVPPPMSTMRLPGRLADRQAGADRGGHRLLDEAGPAGAGVEGGVADGALLDLGHARRDAEQHPRPGDRARPGRGPCHEVLDHLLGHVEVADDAVAQRADRDDVGRRPADHPLGLGADGQDPLGLGVDGHDRRLAHDDPAVADVDQRVGGPEVDPDVAGEEAEDAVEHGAGRVLRGRGRSVGSRRGHRRGRAGRAGSRPGRAGSPGSIPGHPRISRHACRDSRLERSFRPRRNLRDRASASATRRCRLRRRGRRDRGRRRRRGRQGRRRRCGRREGWIHRWIPANVKYVGFFSNFLLMASFLGHRRRASCSAGAGRAWPLSPFPPLLLATVAARLRRPAERPGRATPNEIIFGLDAIDAAPT